MIFIINNVLIRWYWGTYQLCVSTQISLGLPGGSAVKTLPANAGDMGLIPESWRSPREGNGYPL